MKNRKRNRLKGYDYSRDNLYFVTICVQNMVCCLGEVVRTAHELSVPDSVDFNGGLVLAKSNSDKLDAKQSSQIMLLNAYGLIVENQIN